MEVIPRWLTGLLSDLHVALENNDTEDERSGSLF